MESHASKIEVVASIGIQKPREASPNHARGSMQRKTSHKTIPNITLQKTKVHNSILMFRDQVQMKKIIQRKLIKEINSSIAVGRFNLLYQEHRILL